MKHYIQWRNRMLRDPSQHRPIEFEPLVSTRDIIICGLAAFCLVIALGALACLLCGM